MKHYLFSSTKQQQTSRNPTTKRQNRLTLNPFISFQSLLQNNIMYITVNESSTHTVDDDLPCDQRMMMLQLQDYASLSHGKSVSFADEALLYSSSLFIDQVIELWYNKDEYIIFKDNRRSAVKLLRSQKRQATTHHSCTIRGLEAYVTVETNRAMKEARATAIQAVLNEQRLQRQLGFYDPDVLRDVSVSATEGMRSYAFQLARTDSSLSTTTSILPLPSLQQQSVSTIDRTSFQLSMTQQRSQRRLLMQEDDHNDMDGIMAKLESAMYLVKTLDINPRSCCLDDDEYEPIGLNRMI